ncbi:AsmA family protein [Jannaschia sp. S6380]|uniref:AsmA family protein n=1 Tax=Jannaschia sp. S6380 TaxID=2926408 RepID=UPI001FF6E0B7|nr:AsmA family protein [Jannaschia sp. S6380]MCK0169230.1 AsmA family protein [Jannaschia sp. S6380]
MKWLLRGGLTFLTLVLVAVVVLFLVPAERVAQLAADRFAAQTGRALTFGGPVRATLWPTLGVRAEDVAIANADWAGEDPLLLAGLLEVGISPGSLLGGDIRIETLRLVDARLVLERRADGIGNWEMTTGESASSPSSDGGAGSGRGLSIEQAEVTGADITWIDRAAGRTLRARAVDVKTGSFDPDGAAEITGSALVGGRAIQVEASATALQQLLDGALTPIALAVTAGATSLRLEGRADLDPLSFEGRMAARSGDGFAVLDAFGIAPPDLPRGLGAGDVELDAALTLAPVGTLHLRDMVADLDQNRLTGAMDVDPRGARPAITATIAAEALDLTSISRKGQGGESAIVAETGWGRDPIDASGLFTADADVTLTAGPVTLGDATLDDVAARLLVQNGRAVVTFQPIRAYGGTVTGDFVVNGRGGLSARADLRMAGLRMQPFLTDFADFDRLIGEADLTVNLLGVGDTAQALVESLDGDVGLRVGQGELLGLDIGGMVRTLDLSYRGEGQKTIFDDITASFIVRDGVASGDDLRLSAPYLVATGAGEIDLGARRIDYRLIPVLRRDGDDRGVSVPLSIEGPWADPRIRPDLEYVARQKLDAEREELEARARAEAEAARTRVEDVAREKLAEELDIAPEALDSRKAIEDAIVDRVGEQLIDLLRDR